MFFSKVVKNSSFDSPGSIGFRIDIVISLFELYFLLGHTKPELIAIIEKNF